MVQRRTPFRQQQQMRSSSCLDERPWTTTNSVIGGFDRFASRKPFTPSGPLTFEGEGARKFAHGPHPGLTSEGVGGHYANFAPLNPRPRPASEDNIALRNAAVREGDISSSAVGLHTGFRPQRNFVAGFEPHRRLEPLATKLGVTSQNFIGHPVPPTPVDMRDAARLHSEANFAKRFPLHPNGRGKEAEISVRYQNDYVSRASRLVEAEQTDSLNSTLKRMVADAQQGAWKMTGKASPDRYTVGTPPSPPRGVKLPARSFMPPGTGSPLDHKSRAMDF